MYGLNIILEASLKVQWLNHASTAGDKDLFLVRELSSHKLCGVVEKKKERKESFSKTSYDTHVREEKLTRYSETL